ncbi:MAG: hypothetical protein LH606_11290, partial [Cytophagaceae bacterium]|nr:hypothetical protein [Cytophagaceae bacterium]
MNRFLLPLLLFFLTVSGSLAQSVFRIDSLPPQGVLLDKGWKWHAGDNPDWAKPEFDDSQWEAIDPTKDIFELPQIPKTGKIVWLRLRLASDSALHQSLVLMIQQAGASELYLNGKRIHQFGVVSATTDQIKAFNPLNSPVSFPVSTKGVQVLAIRYAFQPNIRYATHFGSTNPLFTVKLHATDKAISEYTNGYNREQNRNFTKAAVFAILSLLFFTLFVFFPVRKAHLYFSVYALLSAVSWYIFSFVSSPAFVETFYGIKNAVMILQTIGYLFMLNAVYATFQYKKGLFYWAMVLSGIVAILVGALAYGWGWMIYGFFFNNFISIDITRVSVIAVRQHHKGAWIVLAGCICYLVCWFIFSLQFSGVLAYGGLLAELLFDISMLSISVAFAVFLAYDFGLTNRILQQKLKENETLSAEKQQILATQNETLERQVSERTADLNYKNRELEIEAALERVRSRAMAMQKSDELQQAAVLLFQQVQALGIPAWSCGYNIWEKEEKVCTGWMSSEGAVQPPFRIPLTESPTFIRFYESRQKGESFYVESIGGEALEAHYRYMFSLPDFREIGDEHLKAGFSLPTFQINHVVNFTHGNLIFITDRSVPEAWDTFKRFATVFEQTYTRFLDLQKAEAQALQAKLDLIQIQTEKKRAEDTLSELRTTQTQLIQKEKMASLGELTAGIAHEIQNPLNFVNNFSEVSTELVGELKEEVTAGNHAEVLAIADDLTQNLQKITQHGQRASSIVRGMLEHSRTSTGEKQPTDLNALADEYLRLAYHGLRAKDSSFNAELKMDFDPNLGLVEVVPQEIGRVLLNLFNNAFYAVQEKQKQQPNSYQPTVSVSTKR